jgi:hypothetical protein
VGSINIGRMAVAILFAVVALSVATTASAAAPTPERHCVVEVIGDVGGTLITGPETCYRSRAGAAYHAAASAVAPSPGVLSRAAGTNVISVHYTSTNFGGSSITIIGTTCAGGVWYASGWWNNNIESSRHYCGGRPTTFYDWTSCSGSSLAIYSQQNSLGSLNNRVSCVRYG